MTCRYGGVRSGESQVADHPNPEVTVAGIRSVHHEVSIGSDLDCNAQRICTQKCYQCGPKMFAPRSSPIDREWGSGGGNALRADDEAQTAVWRSI